MQSVLAQDPIHWTWKYVSNSNELQFKASIMDGWYLYSQHIPPEIGPVPTHFSFEIVSQVALVGSVNEPIPFKKFDENFQDTLDFFKKEAVFTQQLKGNSGMVKGIITYMVCNETMCLPPSELPFSFTIAKN
jgi:thiol:disulfide interchange protein